MTALNAHTHTGTSPEIRAIEHKASGSSFYTAMRLMPKAEREAMFAIYAFCRAVDDIADDEHGGRAERRAELGRWRADIDSLYAGSAPPRTRFLTEALTHYHLRKDDFLTVIDGMEMDVHEDIRAPDLATLDLYCDRVASAVGRLSVRVFGMDEEPGKALAHHLGRALQLTNILRDLDEDASLGRLYLPRELLDEAGIASREPSEVIGNPAVDGACRGVAKIAWQHYGEANRILRSHPAGRLRAPRLMSEVYSRILAKMESLGWEPPRQRARINKGALLLILLRHGLAG